jgi:hypothetical protein
MTKKERQTAIIVGALFLIALVAAIVGGTLIDAILNAADPLSEVADKENQLVTGVLLEMINGLAVVGIATLLFPILKRQDESLALSYVALRVIESVIIIAAVVAPVVLISLAQEQAAGGADASSLPAAGAALLAVRERLVGQFTGIFFGLAALPLYTLLYQSRLVPRFISVWGLIAVALVVIWNLLKLFGIEVDAGMIFGGLPIILNELFLALWLIVKGFSGSAEVYQPARPIVGEA